MQPTHTITLEIEADGSLLIDVFNLATEEGEMYSESDLFDGFVDFVAGLGLELAPGSDWRDVTSVHIDRQVFLRPLA